MLTPISFLSRSDAPEGDQGINEVQVGGLNTSDSRFAVYKNYKGCLSSKCVCLLQDGAAGLQVTLVTHRHLHIKSIVQYSYCEEVMICMTDFETVLYFIKT